MAYQTGDGRWIVGLGAEGESSYNGFAAWRDCVIQLTADGATEQSVKYLEGLRDYAIAHSAIGESIMPPSVNVWVSNNGTTTAVQADDLAVDGETFTICGIKWDGSDWDYTNAGQGGGGGGGGSGGNVVVAHATVKWNDETSQYDVTSFDKTFSELWELFGVSPCFVELQFPGDWETVLLSLIARSPENTGELTSPASVSFSNVWNTTINTLSVFSDGSFSVSQDFIQTT